MFSQMTKAKSKSINKVKSFRIMKTVDRLLRWPHERKDIALKNQQTLSFCKTKI